MKRSKLPPPGNSLKMMRQRGQVGKDVDTNLRECENAQTLRGTPAPHRRAPTTKGVEAAGALAAPSPIPRSQQKEQPEGATRADRKDVWGTGCSFQATPPGGAKSPLTTLPTPRLKILG